VNPNAETARNITADLLAAYYVSPRPDVSPFDLRDAITAALDAKDAALGAASAGGEVERLREACEGLLASIRSRYPNDFMPGGKGYVCPHHLAIAAALATDASGALTSALSPLPSAAKEKK